MAHKTLFLRLILMYTLYFKDDRTRDTLCGACRKHGKNKVNWEGPKEKCRLRRPKHRWTLKMDHKPCVNASALFAWLMIKISSDHLCTPWWTFWLQEQLGIACQTTERLVPQEDAALNWLRCGSKAIPWFDYDFERIATHCCHLVMLEITGLFHEWWIHSYISSESRLFLFCVNSLEMWFITGMKETFLLLPPTPKLSIYYWIMAAMSWARGRYYEWYIESTTMWAQKWRKVVLNLFITTPCAVHELPCYFVMM